jgi:glycosyltransferase involved in cell wall biosynthesis
MPVRVSVVNKTPSHSVYAGMLCGALADDGHEVRYLGPRPVGGASFVNIRTTRTSARDGLSSAANWPRDVADRLHWDLRGSDLVLDVHASTSLWVLGSVARVRVLHRTDLFLPGARRGGVRRGRVAQLARAGTHFVVHTPRALQTLREFLPPGAASLMPLMGPPPAPRGRREPRSVPELLFVGDDRWEKGFNVLLDAVCDLDVVVRHVGGEFHPAPVGERRIGRAHLVSEGPVGADKLRGAYESCDLVVCPYDQERYLAGGSGSRVLAESLAFAAPLLLTPALSELVPAGYGGAIVAQAATADAIRAALEGADLAELSLGAATEAPALAAAAAPGRYVARLLACAVAGGPDERRSALRSHRTTG